MGNTMQARVSKGFTLMELMIVVAIFAIIASIGYPIYVEQAKKSRRSDAKVALSDNAQSVERCRSNTNTYVGCATVNSPSGYYIITMAAAASTYTLTATATGVQANDKCTIFTITNTGVKGATLPDCW